MTVREIEAALRNAGIEDALWEALLLAEHFTGRSATLWRADRDVEIASPALTEAVKKRASRYPLQYIFGTWEFMGLPFRVDEDCLIPRPDTEILVEAAIEEIRRMGASVRVLDLCTGSGCILASVLHHCPGTVGTAVELYPAAMAIAQKNFVSLGLSERIRTITGDIRENLLPAGDLYDVILSNPPYVTTAEMAELAPELAYEPVCALTDGGDGLSLYRAIFENYLPHLAPAGLLLLEHGAAQSEAVLAMARDYGLTGKALYDYGGNARCAYLRRDTKRQSGKPGCPGERSLL